MEEEREVRTGTYELMVILPATYADEEVPTLVTKIESALTELGCKITKSDNSLGKRKLAFPIKHIRQGFYHVFDLEMDRANVNKVDGALRLMPEVLRHLLTIREVRTKEQLEAEAALRERIQQKRIAAEERAVADRSVKEMEETKAAEASRPTPAAHDVSPEELTKKLDELLTDDTLGE